jgi:hypothetical protein
MEAGKMIRKYWHKVDGSNSWFYDFDDMQWLVVIVKNGKWEAYMRYPGGIRQPYNIAVNTLEEAKAVALMIAKMS